MLVVGTQSSVFHLNEESVNIHWSVPVGNPLAHLLKVTLLPVDSQVYVLEPPKLLPDNQ